jgi:hypothetical protein
MACALDFVVARVYREPPALRGRLLRQAAFAKGLAGCLHDERADPQL